MLNCNNIDIPRERFGAGRSGTSQRFNDAALAALQAPQPIAGAGNWELHIADNRLVEAQREFLANNNCHAYQGYLFSEPLPLEAFEAFTGCGAALTALPRRPATILSFHPFAD